MKIFKEVTETQTVTKKVFDKIICDLCKQERNSDNWVEDKSAINEISVEWISGNSYPSGGYNETVSFDICPSCFEEKLVPWLKSQGADPTFHEFDW